MRIPSLLLAAGLVACAPADDHPDAGAITSDAGLYEILYAATPDPPVAGDTELALFLEEAETGDPVVGAGLEVEPWMPSMNHGITGEVEVTELGDGDYVAAWAYSMPGYWEVTVDIDTEAGIDFVVLGFDVE